MSYTRNYVIAGGRGGTPASLSVKMDPVKLDTKMGIALKSIACGELANVTHSCNTFKILYRGEIASDLKYHSTASSVNMVYSLVDSFADSTKHISYDVSVEEYREITLTVPPKRYELREDLFGQVVAAINKFLAENGNEVNCEINNSYGKLSCSFPENVKMVRTDKKSPLTVMDAKVWENEITAEVGEIKPSTDICFIYLNIVQFSFINGKRSRLLCVCPIESKEGYSYIEFANPTYTPIEVHEFSDMTLSIRDIHGKLLELDDRYDTVATLHMKRMRN